MWAFLSLICIIPLLNSTLSVIMWLSVLGEETGEGFVSEEAGSGIREYFIRDQNDSGWMNVHRWMWDEHCGVDEWRGGDWGGVWCWMGGAWDYRGLYLGLEWQRLNKWMFTDRWICDECCGVDEHMGEETGAEFESEGAGSNEIRMTAAERVRVDRQMNV